MDNTGRINQTLKSEITGILYKKETNIVDPELFIGTYVDEAHIIMLKECGLIHTSAAVKLLSVINEIKSNDFKELTGRDTPRGYYLLYEDYLIEKLGMETAGSIQLGRSRNDRNATITKLRVRKLYISLVQELFKLQSSLLVIAGKFSAIVMPAYTHYQAAQPVTLGHYLAGIAVALNRDICSLLYILDDLNESPLGAGAIAGTSININPKRTAELLGFTSLSSNSIEAIASRDYLLRILSCISITGTTLSRYASDLLLWSTSEFNMIDFPDELVGSSSMMPQKRNAFLLEHIQGKTAKALGAFTAAVNAQHAVPFSNSIAVNSGSVSNFGDASEEIISSIILARFMTEGIIPVKERMLQLSKDGFTTATCAADKLTLEAGIPFREAHKIIGSIIKEIIDNSFNDKDKTFIEKMTERFPGLNWKELNSMTAVLKSNYGGGPGEVSLKNCLSNLTSKLNAQKKEFEESERFWNESLLKLEKVVSGMAKS